MFFFIVVVAGLINMARRYHREKDPFNENVLVYLIPHFLLAMWYSVIKNGGKSTINATFLYILMIYAAVASALSYAALMVGGYMVTRYTMLAAWCSIEAIVFCASFTCASCRATYRAIREGFGESLESDRALLEP
jgi:hypothetical protein